MNIIINNTPYDVNIITSAKFDAKKFDAKLQKYVGGDTSYLLTVSPVVVNNDRKIIGVIGLVCN